MVNNCNSTLGTDGRIMLKFISNKQDGRVWTGLGTRQIQVAVSCEHGNELKGTTKCG
jgi:hypothetical protein